MRINSTFEMSTTDTVTRQDMGRLFELVRGMSEAMARLGRSFMEIEKLVVRRFDMPGLGMPVGASPHEILPVVRLRRFS